MLPSIIQDRVDLARAEAGILRDTALEHPDRPVVAKRFMKAAQTIDEVCALLEQMTFVAELNHSTIMARASQR